MATKKKSKTVACRMHSGCSLKYGGELYGPGAPIEVTEDEARAYSARMTPLEQIERDQATHQAFEAERKQRKAEAKRAKAKARAAKRAEAKGNGSQ